ncbi:hypothetical protein [Polaromonas sp. UC242_47]|uniref:hypothetical protein n=1 Tax=Polaromonas sp. UC242_47 TaxID=3374626 RepID=UPI003795324E
MSSFTKDPVVLSTDDLMAACDCSSACASVRALEPMLLASSRKYFSFNSRMAGHFDLVNCLTIALSLAFGRTSSEVGEQ